MHMQLTMPLQEYIFGCLVHRPCHHPGHHLVHHLVRIVVKLTSVSFKACRTAAVKHTIIIVLIVDPFSATPLALYLDGCDKLGVYARIDVVSIIIIPV